ncbi:peptidoglycan D,D-transpeptidase FtsI family protein [Marinococcus luteus]|uniref:peptidoglycan D,D-transpeptidase FtsI family protein n=1 Tax=Marinococcus luteus TaxID=1122204 RepID=UPI002ACCFCC2|nr:penicillin-binding protein 2 [Marinococcus luteus]MDZ5782979.1 penicillin-binding protein 2 [Marinococcus luteus]
MASRKNKKPSIPFRLNVLFFAVFILFSILILRLGYVQIVEGDTYEEDVNETASTSASRVDAPRGIMYDRNGTELVDNNLILTLTYTNQRSYEDEERLQTAEELAELIEFDEEETDRESMPERNLQDYWLLTRENEAEELVSDKEEERLMENDKDPYEVQLDRITEEQLNDISDEELEVVAIWSEMISGYYDSPQRVKRDLTEEEATAISSRLDELEGVDVTRDFQRDYQYTQAFQSLYGKVGSIPEETVSEFLAKGYQRSDEVGQSFLEQYYEDTLRGKKGTVSGEDNDAEETSSGSRGNDLVLSIDMDLQREVQSIVDDQIAQSEGSFPNDEQAYVTAIDPNTGEILAMNGYDDQLGNVTNTFEMGSTVKPATGMIGLQEEVITEDTEINDRPIQLPNSPPISSSHEIGTIDVVGAIQESSNVFMSEIAMRLMDYELGSNNGFNDEKVDEAYTTMRDYYHQFGLGSETGVDLPSESTGLDAGRANAGSLLYFSFGQLDTYTPLQLAQYSATIASDGKRMEPHLVKEIREPNRNTDEMGAVLHQFEPEMMNRVNIDKEYFDIAQEGMYDVVNTELGTADSYFNDVNMEIAGKTGTAQREIRRESDNELVEVNNQTFIAYGPYENPEIAIAVVVPNAYSSDEGGRSGIANSIAADTMQAYVNLKEERPGAGSSEDEDENEEDDENAEDNEDNAGDEEDSGGEGEEQ